MPIISYVVYPQDGQKTQLVEALTELQHCQVIPSTNEEIVILVTDTPDKESDKKLSSVISEIPFLKHMSMTFAHDD